MMILHVLVFDVGTLVRIENSVELLRPVRRIKLEREKLELFENLISWC